MAPDTTISPNPYELLIITAFSKPDSVSIEKLTPAEPISERHIF